MAWHVPDPETLRKAVTETVQRLIDALAAEAKLGRQRCRKRLEPRLFRQRRAAQRSIAQRAEDYKRAVGRYRQAIQALFRNNNRQNVQGRVVRRQEHTSQRLHAMSFKSPRF
jgi:hypothetical protein